MYEISWCYINRILERTKFIVINTFFRLFVTLLPSISQTYTPTHPHTHTHAHTRTHTHTHFLFLFMFHFVYHSRQFTYAIQLKTIHQIILTRINVKHLSKYINCLIFKLNTFYIKNLIFLYLHILHQYLHLL